MSPHEVSLRPARWGDVRQVWAWNNAPDVRGWSLHVDPIPFEDHQRWFRGRLEDPEHRCWIVQVDGLDAGVVRVDSAGVVSIALAEPTRWRGVGTRALTLACADEAKTLEAWIAEDNAASVRCFERCGFERHGVELRDGRRFARYQRYQRGAGRQPLQPLHE